MTFNEAYACLMQGEWICRQHGSGPIYARHKNKLVSIEVCGLIKRITEGVILITDTNPSIPAEDIMAKDWVVIRLHEPLVPPQAVQS